MNKRNVILTMLALTIFMACEKEEDPKPMPIDPDTADEVMVDRFSATAGHLFVRTTENGLPGPNEAINFDNNPAFITNGLGPNGEMTQYYNFDVMSITPAPIFVLIREDEDAPVVGQLNIIDVLPGEEGYNDFWLVNMVIVPTNYVANTITSVNEINAMGYAINTTTIIVNCPVVPKGSTATKRFLSTEDNGLVRGWYKSKVVYYFSFLEKDLSAVGGAVPTSDIFVAFNVNPDMEGGGPPSGFVTENGMANGQTHNVPETIPTDAAYSPLWDVNIYDNADFEMVMDLTTAQDASIMAMDAAIVNCPIVRVN